MTTSRVIVCLLALLIAVYAFPSEQVIEEKQTIEEEKVDFEDNLLESSLDSIENAAGLTASGLTCTSISNKGEVYILNPSKNLAFCSVSSTVIAKADVSANQNNPLCKWTMYECTGNDATQTKFKLFGHPTQGNNGLKKHLLSTGSSTMQMHIPNKKSDVGQFYRAVPVLFSNGGVRLVNAKSGLYVSEDGVSLTHGGSAVASFKICPVGGLSTC